MKLNTTSNLEVYQFENLLNHSDIHHCITTRKGGISEGYTDSLNLGMGVEDHVNYVEENRRRLAGFMGVSADRLIFQKQTHSVNYKIITDKNFRETIMNNDALITAEKGIAIAALGADCVPVLLYDKKNKVVASIHAGWKGTVNGIVNVVMEVLKNEFNTDPANVIAGIGPSISAKNYEVGSEVIEAFEKAFSNSDQMISNRHDDKAHIDLWLGNKTWLLNHGVPEENIEISGLCTYDQHETFFSARYFKNRTGRFGGCIVLK